MDKQLTDILGIAFKQSEFVDIFDVSDSESRPPAKKKKAKLKRVKRDFNEYQHRMPFNRIEVHKGLMLAPKGKHAAKNLEARGSDYLIDNLLDDFQVYLGQERLKRSVYRKSLTMLLANAKIASNLKAQVIIGRKNGHGKGINPKKIDARTTNDLLDFMADIGLVYYVIGKDNEFQENSSFFAPLPKLEAMLAHSKVMGVSGGYVVLHDKNKRVIPWPKKKTVLLEVARMERELETYCRLLFEQEITLFGLNIVPFAKRVFNINTRLGGRIYADWEVFSKEERSTIKINNSKTVELDYSTIHYHILYALADAELVGDPYIVEGYERDTIKRVSLVMLNSENRSSLTAQITRSGKPEVKAVYNEYQKNMRFYNQIKNKPLSGLIVNPPDKPKVLKGFIEGIPEGTKGSELIDKLLERHEPIADQIGSENIGLRLQNLDAKVMIECVNEATLRNIPVLPVHDSLICQYKHKGVVYGIMRDVFRLQFGREIEVKT